MQNEPKTPIALLPADLGRRPATERQVPTERACPAVRAAPPAVGSA